MTSMLGSRARAKRARQLPKQACLALAALLVSACGQLTMKAPQTPLALRKVAVLGHSPRHDGRDRELSIGSAKVSDVKGTAIYPPGLTAYGRVPDQSQWDYQYQVRDGQRTLRGECSERAGEVRYYGLGETTLDVSCRCSVAERQVAEISIVRGAGNATISPAQRFAVFGTRGSQQGKEAREILGYRFQSGKSVGAVDVTKSSGAYYAENLSPEERDALTCLYAGILLHRAHR